MLALGKEVRRLFREEQVVARVEELWHNTTNVGPSLLSTVRDPLSITAATVLHS